MLALAAAAALNVLTFAPPLMASLPGIGFWPALGVTLSSTASTYVAPGGQAVGMALSYGMLRGWGYRGQRVTLAVGVSGIWNLFVTFGVPSVAVALLALEGGSNPLLRTAATGGIIVFIIMVATFAIGLRSAWQARVVGDTAARAASWALRLVRRGPVSWSGETFVRFRTDAIGLLRARWHWITVTTLAGHLTVYLVLIVTLRAVGIDGSEVSLAESFAAWSIVRVLAALPITPGGFGLVEVGLTGSLIAFGGPQSDVLAAVLIYRLLTVGPPLVLGALFAATWRRRHAEWTPDEFETAGAEATR
jgi:uncharacterized membrane protein YbhN (UPF0104 family)